MSGKKNKASLFGSKKLILPESSFYSSKQTKPWHNLLNFRQFSSSSGIVVKNPKHQKVPPCVYLQFRNQSINLRSPNWVLETRSFKKLVLLFKTTSFLHQKPQLFFHLIFCLAIFVHQSGKHETRKSCSWSLSTNNSPVKKSQHFFLVLNTNYPKKLLLLFKTTLEE